MKIDVSMPGADVLVDDELIGRSPLGDVVDVAPGSRKIEARLAGYPTATAQLNVAMGQQVPVSLKLEKSGSSAVVTDRLSLLRSLRRIPP